MSLRVFPTENDNVSTNIYEEKALKNSLDISRYWKNVLLIIFLTGSANGFFYSVLSLKRDDILRLYSSLIRPIARIMVIFLGVDGTRENFETAIRMVLFFKFFFNIRSISCPRGDNPFPVGQKAAVYRQPLV